MANTGERDREPGRYESKQLLSRIPFLSWSHRRRFALARRLVGPYAGGRLLDYGCGDGTFLAMVKGQFSEVVGIGDDSIEIDDCKRRFRLIGSEQPCLVVRTQAFVEGNQGGFQVVTCMEVLEHCLPSVVDSVLDDLSYLVSPSGAVIISVPIETGLSLPAKQIIRRLASRKIYDYKFNDRYCLKDLWRMVIARSSTKIERPVYGSAPHQFHSHKGFNWRALKRKVSKKFVLERTRFTPLGLAGMFNSQAWFICHKRE